MRALIMALSLGLVIATVPTVADSQGNCSFPGKGIGGGVTPGNGRSPGEFRGGVQCQDVEQLTYPDGSFDLVTSTEVFEHVPDDRRAFAEVYRVLRPGGRLVFTVPLMDAGPTLERAEIRYGRIVHLVTPEYHGDRLRGRGRVLAFRTYGPDILDRLRAAGFAASLERIDDPAHAIIDGRVVVGEKAAA